MKYNNKSHFCISKFVSGELCLLFRIFHLFIPRVFDIYSFHVSPFFWALMTFVALSSVIVLMSIVFILRTVTIIDNCYENDRLTIWKRLSVFPMFFSFLVNFPFFFFMLIALWMPHFDFISCCMGDGAEFIISSNSII